jgi:transcriptional regulator with XRE-family HTH domain
MSLSQDESPRHHLDDPAVQRRRLKVELRKLRLAANETQESVARAMEWSKSKVIRIEGGETRITRTDLKALLEHYGVTDEERVESLLTAAKVAREHNWATYRDVHSAGFLRYLDYESSSAIVRNYEDHWVPGLLQTEEYCLAAQKGAYGKSDDVAERRWSARLQRQRLHDRNDPPEMAFVLDESIVRRPIGGTGVMRRQLEQLLAYADMPHITLQVLPIAAGATPGLIGPFVLLEFEEATDDPVLYLEADSRTTREAPEETSTFLDRFLLLADLALKPDESTALVHDAIDRVESTSEIPALVGAEDEKD